IEDGYLISGITYSYETVGGWDAWLIKTDKEGNEIWKKGYGGSFKDCKKINDGYIFCGNTNTFSVGRSDAWVLKIDEEGNEIWNRSFGTRSTDAAFSIEILDENQYIIVGEKYYETHEDVDWRGWVIKFVDYFPPKIEIVKPKNYFYIFDREIFPTEIPIILGDITVRCDAFDPMNRIDRVEFYLLLVDLWYEYKPRKIDYSPPYEWKWRIGTGLYEVTVGAFYGKAGSVVSDRIIVWIFNP
ncbi:MAG: hypothetical protein QXW78_02890, partial [Candidatus Thermoplasmatota archaeon]